jgi:hypothetical protein
MTEHPGTFSDASPAARQEGVARDLDAIFGRRRRRPAKGTAVAVIPTRRRRSSWPWILLAGIVVAALAAAAVALLLGYGSSPAHHATVVKPRVIERREPLPRAASVSPSPAPDQPAVVAPPPAALRTGNQAPDVRAPAATSATPDRVTRPASGNQRRVARADDRPARSRRAEGGATRCGDLRPDERAWCLRPRVLEANRELTRLYDQARRAGVDSQALSRLRGQWASLQRKANSRPDETLAGYHDLRLDLLDLLDDQRADPRGDQ